MDIHLDTQILRMFGLLLIIILVLDILDNKIFNSAYSSTIVEPVCVICYTYEDRSLDISLKANKTVHPSNQLNFSFTDPVNGSLMETDSGLLYVPEKDFVGNDVFSVRLQNKSNPQGFSTIPVQISVRPDDTDQVHQIDLIWNYAAIIIFLIASAALIVVFIFLFVRHKNRKSKIFSETISNDNPSERVQHIAILGTNFGKNQGIVLFGERVISNKDIISWNDTHIKIKVDSLEVVKSYKIRVITVDNRITPEVEYHITI